MFLEMCSVLLLAKWNSVGVIVGVDCGVECGVSGTCMYVV